MFGEIKKDKVIVMIRKLLIASNTNTPPQTCGKSPTTLHWTDWSSVKDMEDDALVNISVYWSLPRLWSINKVSFSGK